MATCAICGREDQTAQMELTGRGLVCPSCHYDRVASRGGGGFGSFLRKLHPLAIVGVLAAAAPFCITFTVSGSRAQLSDGLVAAFTVYNYLVLGCGALAVVMGGILIALSRRPGGGWRKKRLWIAIGVAAIGLYHIGNTLGYLPDLPLPLP